MSIWVRTCQECGLKQIATPPPAKMTSAWVCVIDDAPERLSQLADSGLEVALTGERGGHRGTGSHDATPIGSASVSMSSHAAGDAHPRRTALATAFRDGPGRAPRSAYAARTPATTAGPAKVTRSLPR